MESASDEENDTIEDSDKSESEESEIEPAESIAKSLFREVSTCINYWYILNIHRFLLLQSLAPVRGHLTIDDWQQYHPLQRPRVHRVRRKLHLNRFGAHNSSL